MKLLTLNEGMFENILLMAKSRLSNIPSDLRKDRNIDKLIRYAENKSDGLLFDDEHWIQSLIISMKKMIRYINQDIDKGLKSNIKIEKVVEKALKDTKNEIQGWLKAKPKKKKTKDKKEEIKEDIKAILSKLIDIGTNNTHMEKKRMNNLNRLIATTIIGKVIQFIEGIENKIAGSNAAAKKLS